MNLSDRSLSDHALPTPSIDRATHRMTCLKVLGYIVLFGMLGAGTAARGAQALPTPATAPASSNAVTGRTRASDARWYQIDVAMFANGEPDNDAGGVTGDLQGVRSRLPYLKTLGVNVLYLTAVFQPRTDAPGRVDWRHINPTVSDSGVDPQTSESSPPRGANSFTSGDRVFLAMVKAAHDAGFRIVLDLAVGDRPGSIGTVAEAAKDLVKLSHRWMDLDGDGNAADGVDGWVVRGADELPRKSIKAWSAKARSRNPDALLVADGDRTPTTLIASDGFDSFIDRAYARAIRDFIGVVPKPMSAEPFLAKLEAIGKGDHAAARSIAPRALSGPAAGRFFRPVKSATADAKSSNTPSDTRASSDHKKKPSSSSPTNQSAARWRLATVLQHFLPGAPMTFYGDEIGLTGGSRSRVPMVWPDAPGSSQEIAERHPDFASLIQWLHARRGVDVPLRDGALRVAFIDADRQVFALARTLPGDEAVLVVNYGNTKRKIMLWVGQPGRLAALLTPVLAPRRLSPGLARRLPPPVHGIAPLLMGASRQRIDNDGRIRVWVDPMAVRYILLQD